MFPVMRQVLATPEKAMVAARQLSVLHRAGMFSLARPGELVTSAWAVRRWGPLAGAVKVAAQRYGSRTALVDDVGALSFADLDRRSDALASAWRAAGLDESTTIALLCRDHRGLVDAMYAGAKLGAGLVMLNTGFAAPALAEVVAREAITVLVVDEEFAELTSGLPQSVTRYAAWVEPDSDGLGARVLSLESLIAGAATSTLPPPPRIGRLVMLTSGTTGTPKGAPREIRSPLVVAQFLDRIPLRGAQTTFLGAPLFHGTGLSQFLLSFALGGTTIFRRRFDPTATLKAVEDHSVDTLVLVPTMLQRIVNLGTDAVRSFDTSSIRIVFCAGSALPPALGIQATELFGEVIYNLYGSTEVAVATVATPADLKLAPGTVGRAPVGCRYRLYDDDGRPITANNQTGRVFVGSGLSFAEYTGGGAKEVIDGLLSSGDVGHIDDNGLLFIDGRDDDMIVSGGENLFPGEVENLLVGHPDIGDAAVVGVPDDEFGQRLKAVVVRRDGSTLTGDDVKAYVKGHLARFKVPRDVEFVAQLPRNATGKLLRKQLTDQS